MARRRKIRAAAIASVATDTRSVNTSWRCSAQKLKQPRSSFTAISQYTLLRAQKAQSMVC